MIKATIPSKGGRTALYVGLSFGNLDRFRERPLDTFIKIDGKEMGLPIDIVLFSGRTEPEMAELLAGGIGPDTKVNISPRFKQ